MRVVVVGGGVVGLLTALEGALSGHAVTLVEQSNLPNPHAASSDAHRVVRALHPSDPQLSKTALEALRRWVELEALVDVRCLVRTGALTVMGGAALDHAAADAASAGVDVLTLDPDALAGSYGVLTLPPDAAGILEPGAAVLLASRFLGACLRWLRAQPRVTLLARRSVVEVRGETAAVRLADGEELRGDALVVAAGAWTASLLPAVSSRLTLYRQSLLYCSVPRDRATECRSLPVVLSVGAAGAWLVPPVARTALKLSAASACREVDSITGHSTPAAWRDHLVQAFRRLLAGFGDAWVTGARDCYYVAAESGSPLVCPLADRSVALAACGGVSFKFAPLIARSLLRRATGDRPAQAQAQVPGRDDDPWMATSSS